MFSVVYDDRVAVASAFDNIPENWTLLDCRALIDGPGNAPELLDQIVDDAIAKINSGQRLCFACDYGQSRSNLLAAISISKITQYPLSEALDIVQKAHHDSAIKPGLLQGLVETKAPLLQTHFAITGGHGLIGKPLTTSLLETGNSVTVFSRTFHGDYLNNASALTYLLNNKNITEVVHLAHPKPYNSYKTTAESFGHLVSLMQSCIATDCRLHFISSWVVFDGSSEQLVTENSPPCAHSLYAQSKITQEEFLRMHATNQGLRCRIYRLPGIYDPQSLEPRFLRYFADCIRSKSDIIYHSFENGSAVVPLCSAIEIARLLQAALTMPPETPGILHLSAATSSCSIQEIAESVGAAYGIKALPTPVKRKAFAGSFSTKYLHLFDSLTSGSQSPKQSVLEFLDGLVQCR